MLNKELRAKLDDLEKWFKENPKLPQEIDGVLLRRFLKCMNNDVEEAQKLIELNYGMRNKHSNLFIERDPENENIVKIHEVSDILVLPGLTPEGNRLLFYRLADYDPKKMNNFDECKIFYMVADCRFSQIDIEKPAEQNDEQGIALLDDVEQDEDDEIANGEVHLVDIAGFTMSHIARLSLSLFRTHMKFLQEAYPIRLRAMHIINCPTFLNKMVAIVKPFIQDDVFKMIKFHTNGLDSLYEQVPRDMLPEEYGGQAGTIAELKKHWAEQLRKRRDYLMDAKQWKVEQTASRGRWYWF